MIEQFNFVAMPPLCGQYTFCTSTETIKSSTSANHTSSIGSDKHEVNEIIPFLGASLGEKLPKCIAINI
jgi:hypothetical protein